MRNNVVDASFVSFFSDTARLSLYLSSASDVELVASYAKEVADLLNSCDLRTAAATDDDERQAKQHNRQCPSEEGDRYQNTGCSPNNLNGRQDGKNIFEVGQQTSANTKCEESHMIRESEPLLCTDQSNNRVSQTNCRETRSTCSVVGDGRDNKTSVSLTSLSSQSECIGTPSNRVHGDRAEQQSHQEITHQYIPPPPPPPPPVFVPQLNFPDSILRYPACVLVIVGQEPKREREEGKKYIQGEKQQQTDDRLSSSLDSSHSSLRASLLRSTSSRESLANNIGIRVKQPLAVHDDLLDKASSFSSSRSHYSSSPSLNVGCDVQIPVIQTNLAPEVHVHASSEDDSSGSNYSGTRSSCTSNKLQKIFLRVVGDPKRRRRRAEREIKHNSGNYCGSGEVAADNNAVRLPPTAATTLLLPKQTGYSKPKSVILREKDEEEPEGISINDYGDSPSDILLPTMASDRVLSKDVVQQAPIIRSAWAELEGDRSLSFETI